MDKVCYSEYSLEGVGDAAKKMQYCAGHLLNEMQSHMYKLPDHGNLLQYSCQINLSRIIFQSNQLNYHFHSIQKQITHVQQEAGTIYLMAQNTKMQYNLLENTLSTMANAIVAAIRLNPIANLIGNLIDKQFEYARIVENAEKLIEKAELELENVINQILIQSANMQIQIKQNFGNIFNDDFELDRSEYIKRSNMPTSFLDMNIDKLTAKNPDILRKGVRMGFNGEFWNSDKQQQCTFYAAARRTQIGKPLPQNGAWGNAKSWVNSARNSGLKISAVPENGDVFCVGGTSWGHVGIVERVYNDGSILISEANWDFKGSFGTRIITPKQYATWNFIK